MIKASAGALVENLNKSRPSYIRTIKPNQNRSSTEYDTKAIVHQIKYLGLQENIRVRRAGFAYRNTFEKMVERFYLLSPATSYAGDYTWTGDAKSGIARILKDTGIASEEWQMGVTKAFIKNPETVSCTASIISFNCLTESIDSSSPWRPCAISIGTTWLHEYNVPIVIICDTRMNVLDAYSDFGRTIKKVLNTRNFGTTVIKFSAVGRSVDGLVCLVIVASWEIIWISTEIVLLAESCDLPATLEVSALKHGIHDSY